MHVQYLISLTTNSVFRAPSMNSCICVLWFPFRRLTEMLPFSGLGDPSQIRFFFVSNRVVAASVGPVGAVRNLKEIFH